MKWKTPDKIRHGDKQIRKYFAFTPTELDDGYTVWLESYTVEEIWYEVETDSAMSHWKSLKSYRNSR